MDIKKETQNYLTIILPFGKYQYAKLPMGLSISADIFQQEMSKLFADMEHVLVYIDEILVVTKSTFKDHMDKLQAVLAWLQSRGMQLNAAKSFFAATKLDYLGYIISREGLRPQQNKIHAIINMGRPQTVK